MFEHHTGNVCFAQIFQVRLGQRVISHHAVSKLGTFAVHGAAAGFDVVAADFANHAQHAVEVVQRISIIHRSSFKFFGKFVIVFAQSNSFEQIEVVQREFKIAVIRKKVRHDQKTLPLSLGLEGLDHLRNYHIQVTDNRVVRNREDRSVGIGVDRNDLF